MGKSALSPRLGFEGGQYTHFQGTNWWAISKRGDRSGPYAHFELSNKKDTKASIAIGESALSPRLGFEGGQ